VNVHVQDDVGVARVGVWLDGVRRDLKDNPWPVGAMALAVQPLFGFINRGVNNDAGLFAAGAAVLWLVARVFRRGLDRSRVSSPDCSHASLCCT
jgi:hypothetical protein